MKNLELPPGVQQQVQAAHQQQAMVHTTHMNIAIQAMASMTLPHDNEEDLKRKAETAWNAATALLNEYGITVSKGKS